MSFEIEMALHQRLHVRVEGALGRLGPEARAAHEGKANSQELEDLLAGGGAHRDNGVQCPGRFDKNRRKRIEQILLRTAID
jgi:hypothetical protein